MWALLRLDRALKAGDSFEIKAAHIALLDYLRNQKNKNVDWNRCPVARQFFLQRYA